MDVLAAIRSQIMAAQADLHTYPPQSMDWTSRAFTTADYLIPWLVQVAPGLKCYVQDVLNAPVVLRSMWGTIRKHVRLPKEQIEEFNLQLTRDEALRKSVTGEVISNVVGKYLLEYPDSRLKSNSRSDYPDLYLATADYSALPPHERKKNVTAEDEYGAALKGPEKRPARVPDGLEIKTCRNRVNVDCHHPHAGLHLVLLFTESSKVFTVTDLLIAFLRSSDYRERQRNTTATTPKYSFGGVHFVSLL